MNMHYTFDDVLIKPKFSEIKSRSKVDLRTTKFTTKGDDFYMNLPIFSANMATVTEKEMTWAMEEAGGVGVLHRFMSIDDNYDMFNMSSDNAAVSVGLGKNELKRAKELLSLEAEIFFLDVAHGAQKQVADQYIKLKELGCPLVVVGNFGSYESIRDFNDYLEYKGVFEIDAIKVGIGSGSVCTTRIQTGCGVPQLSAILDCKKFCNIYNTPLIADGNCRSPGDIAKAIAAGADAVMLGGMLAGTDETPGEMVYKRVTTDAHKEMNEPYKKYSGSAFKEGEEKYSTSEGVSITIPYKGPVSKVLAEIEGGLRSAFTYVGAKNIKEFQEKAELIYTSPSVQLENVPHYGRK